MSNVITFSRRYPSYHPKCGLPTLFVEKIIQGLVANDVPGYGTENIKYLRDVGVIKISNLDPDSIKNNTIRAGHRWKAGDWFSPRVWLDKPYNSKQVIFGPDVQIKKIWDFSIILGSIVIGSHIMDGEIESNHEIIEKLAHNDGLTKQDLLEWVKYPKPFDGQIICWNQSIEY